MIYVLHTVHDISCTYRFSIFQPQRGHSVRWPGRKFSLGFAKHAHVVLGEWSKQGMTITDHSLGEILRWLCHIKVPLNESPGPVHLQQVLPFQAREAQEGWMIHPLSWHPPKNSDLQQQILFQGASQSGHLLEECHIQRPSWIFWQGREFPRQGSGSQTVSLPWDPVVITTNTFNVNQRWAWCLTFYSLLLVTCLTPPWWPSKQVQYSWRLTLIMG